MKCSPTYPDIDGTYISLKDSVAGIYTAPATLEANPQARNPLMVYASRGANDSDTFSLGVCPIGFVPHTLALVGTPGNLEMTDLVNPASQTFPEGTTVKWGGWKLEGVPAFGADGSSTASADSGSGSAKPPTSYGSVKGRMRLRGVGVTAAKLAGRQIAPKKGSGGPGTMRSGTGAARAEGGRVTYSDGPNSRWLAFPTGTRGDWRVRWHDGRLTGLWLMGRPSPDHQSGPVRR